MNKIIRLSKALLPFAALTAGGCRLLVNTVAITTVAVVGTVGLAGYTVYKGGEAVVTTVGSAGEAVGNKRKSVVMSRGTLKAKAEHSVPDLYASSVQVLHIAGFNSVRGEKDALSGVLKANTATGEEVELNFSLLKAGLTAVEIRVGKGDLKQSEFLYDQILTLTGDES
jgi:hypothetical protein